MSGEPCAVTAGGIDVEDVSPAQQRRGYRHFASRMGILKAIRGGKSFCLGSRRVSVEFY